VTGQRKENDKGKQLMNDFDQTTKKKEKKKASHPCRIHRHHNHWFVLLVVDIYMKKKHKTLSLSSSQNVVNRYRKQKIKNRKVICNQKNKPQ